jgi:hypothetical protein
MLTGLTLQYHCEGAYVASSCTRLRVEILAFGRNEARHYCEQHPPETPQDVRIGTVEMSRLEVPLARRALIAPRLAYDRGN